MSENDRPEEVKVLPDWKKADLIFNDLFFIREHDTEIISKALTQERHAALTSKVVKELVEVLDKISKSECSYCQNRHRAKEALEAYNRQIGGK